MQRRQFVFSAAAATAFPSIVRAQAAWPARPIRLVVPFPPGGGTDTTSRLIAQLLTEQDHWSMVVDNKAGAGGNIGLDAVAKAAPDGYTIGMGQAANLAINPSLYPKMPFNPLTDFVPIACISAQAMILAVRPDSKLKTVADIVAAAKAKPGGFSIAQAGSGTVGHLAGEMLARRAKVQVMQVPYKGAGPAMTDLLGGQVDLYIGNTVSVMPQLTAGTLRAIAITSATRMASFPNVPTVAEQGWPGFEASTWLGLVGPAGLPPAIAQRIATQTLKLVARKDVQDKLAFDGSTARPLDGPGFAALIKAEHAKWGGLIRDAKITVT